MARLAVPRALAVGMAVGLAAVGLAGCGSSTSTSAGSASSAAPTTSTKPAASPLKGADWAKVTSFRCPAPDQKVLVDHVTYGDITGDGVPDAVVSLTCSTETSSNPLRVEAFDGTSPQAHPRSLGVLVSETDPLYVEEAEVTIAQPTVTVSGKGVGPDAALAAGAQVEFSQTFTYQNGTMHPGPRKTGTG
ncbi:MAG TPA: hypothetical protein VH008_03665 [Pseudonocardia sp.]|nr:hypothetical protein [Pseudonocardia sp.]